jgi:hypothetical protein
LGSLFRVLFGKIKVVMKIFRKKHRGRFYALYLVLVLVSSLMFSLFHNPPKALAAVSRTGSVTNIQSGANTSSQSVTVPVDATIAVVTAEGFNSDIAYLQTIDGLTLGGSSLSQQRFDVDSPDGNQTAIWTLVNPSTGAQTLVWNWKGATAFGDGGQINVAFYKGVNTSVPVGSTGGQGIENAANSATASSGALTIAAGDAIVATAYFFDSSNNIALIAGHSSWTNVTAINGPQLFNTSVGSYAEAFPAAGSVTASSNVNAAALQCWTTASFIVLKSAASNSTPAAPTLSLPATSSTDVAARPRFELATTDADNDYLRYKIDICTTSNCSSVLTTLTQPATSSQGGWANQNQQPVSNVLTAYTGNSSIGSSTTAVYFYQPADAVLAPSTQYWWRGYAIDPGGSNTYSSASTISTFTTGTSEVRIQGGTTIMGGTTIQ